MLNRSISTDVETRKHEFAAIVVRRCDSMTKNRKGSRTQQNMATTFTCDILIHGAGQRALRNIIRVSSPYDPKGYQASTAEARSKPDKITKGPTDNLLKDSNTESHGIASSFCTKKQDHV